MDTDRVKSASGLDIVATYNLAYNTSLMPREQIGYVVTMDKLINTEGTDLFIFLLQCEHALVCCHTTSSA